MLESGLPAPRSKKTKSFVLTAMSLYLVAQIT
jgi:hypothetical protein